MSLSTSDEAPTLLLANDAIAAAATSTSTDTYFSFNNSNSEDVQSLLPRARDVTRSPSKRAMRGSPFLPRLDVDAANSPSPRGITVLVLDSEPSIGRCSSTHGCGAGSGACAAAAGDDDEGGVQSEPLAEALRGPVAVAEALLGWLGPVRGLCYRARSLPATLAEEGKQFWAFIWPILVVFCLILAVLEWLD